MKVVKTKQLIKVLEATYGKDSEIYANMKSVMSDLSIKVDKEDFEDLYDKADEVKAKDLISDSSKEKAAEDDKDDIEEDYEAEEDYEDYDEDKEEAFSGFDH